MECNNNVTSIWEPNFNPVLGLYCNKHMYRFAFTVMLVYYSFGLFLLCIPCCLIYCGMLYITNAKLSAAGGCLGSDEEVGKVGQGKDGFNVLNTSNWHCLAISCSAARHIPAVSRGGENASATSAVDQD